LFSCFWRADENSSLDCNGNIEVGRRRAHSLTVFFWQINFFSPPPSSLSLSSVHTDHFTWPYCPCCAVPTASAQTRVFEVDGLKWAGVRGRAMGLKCAGAMRTCIWGNDIGLQHLTGKRCWRKPEHANRVVGSPAVPLQVERVGRQLV
jgi:hypothetical protein